MQHRKIKQAQGCEEKDGEGMKGNSSRKRKIEAGKQQEEEGLEVFYLS